MKASSHLSSAMLLIALVIAPAAFAQGPSPAARPVIIMAYPVPTTLAVTSTAKPRSSTVLQPIRALPGEIVAPLPRQIIRPLPSQVVSPLPGQIVPPLRGQITRPLPGQIIQPLPGQIVQPLPGQIVR